MSRHLESLRSVALDGGRRGPDSILLSLSLRERGIVLESLELPRLHPEALKIRRVMRATANHELGSYIGIYIYIYMGYIRLFRFMYRDV